MKQNNFMRPSVVMRICVVLEWVFIGLYIAFSILLESSLPSALREWLAAGAERDLALPEIALVWAFLVLSMIGSVGLLFLKRWGAWIYLISLIIGHVLSISLMGPTVEHALTGAFYDIATLLSGLIIGLAFFSDALRTADAAPSVLCPTYKGELVPPPLPPAPLPGSTPSTVEVVLADGLFSESVISFFPQSASFHFFITITNQRVICTQIGGKGVLKAKTLGAGLGAGLGGGLGLVLGSALGAGYASAWSDDRAKQIANAPIPQKLTLFPDTTSVHPLNDVSVEKSIWTGKKLVIGLSRYVCEDSKKLRAFEAALKSLSVA